MPPSNPEILLALRSPDSGWLGVLATVLDEANQDPRFDAAQRDILRQLLNQERMPREIGDAARHRAAVFETEIIRDCQAAKEAAVRPTAPERPKLTLVGKLAS
ncbi:hypothetical protein [Oleiagrimonas soli]|uniref:Uncharacterized protein n=1 Tax=Oleiagrimonas soli TaxID=1543381 RepID=A0A099CVC7_9GAMM|nr:hypothetical protein [Oleiagrimonas soli]KGI77631.1 hypothetical protein LF63_0110065 [Oleiagrimonas soli]MBB6182870.1 hypothetical protein [Oleiagrimonas soli]